jgi:uroporphyrinogen-III synthase
VLVPRGGKWGDGVAATLRSFGAVPVIAPVINFASTDNEAALADALARLERGSFDWIVITSATTVDVLVSQQVSIPDKTRVAAVGETTAAALLLANYRVDFVPEVDNSARGLVKEWPEAAGAGRVLIPHSDIAEPTIVAGLAGPRDPRDLRQRCAPDCRTARSAADRYRRCLYRPAHGV